MRFVGKLLLVVFLFLFFLAWRFPYDTLVERSVRNLESNTGVQLSYTPVSAGPMGVKVRDVKVTLPSGANLIFNSTRFFPIRGGVKAELIQEEGEAELSLANGVVTVEMANVVVDTNNSEIGTTRLTGDLSYSLAEHDGKGHLRMVVKEFAALPVDGALELGSSFVIRNLGSPDANSDISAQLKLVSQDGTFSADGPVTLKPQPGGSPFISGNLRFDHPLGPGTLILGGRWNDLQMRVVPNS